MPVEWESDGTREIVVSFSEGDYKLVDGSWWRCTEANDAVTRWESVDPPKFVRRKYRAVDAIRKLKQEG